MAPTQQSLQPTHRHSVLLEVKFIRHLVPAFLLGLIFLTPQILFATVNPFTTHMVIGGDETPPTVPVPFGAVAVSSSQIDLIWGASTDDVALSGYRVFRDSVQIATTTLTTFSDVGLTAETTYTYYVDAFDIFYNYSTSSDFATATTLAKSVSPTLATNTPSTAGGSNQIAIMSPVIVIPQQFSVLLKWTTSVPTSYVIRWGRTDSYELGSVHGSQFLSEHTTVITDLELATSYFYEIEGWQGRVKVVTTRGQFTTTGTIPAEAVPNVQNLHAVVEDTSVQLRWQNPAMFDFFHVRVMRSHLFYPQHSTDGIMVYEGFGEGFLDSGVLEQKPSWYYTIFVYNKNGRISSGATVFVRLGSGELNDQSGEEVEIPFAVDLFAMNVALTQGSTTSYLHNPDTFLALEPLFVSIPVSAVPKHLKSIIVTVTNISLQQESTSYLLKINPEGTAYETLLPPVLVAGRSLLTVTVYNYELATVRTVSNYINFEIDLRSTPLPWWVKALLPRLFLILFLLLGLCLILYRWWSYKKQDVETIYDAS